MSRWWMLVLSVVVVAVRSIDRAGTFNMHGAFLHRPALLSPTVSTTMKRKLLLLLLPLLVMTYIPGSSIVVVFIFVVVVEAGSLRKINCLCSSVLNFNPNIINIHQHRHLPPPTLRTRIRSQASISPLLLLFQVPSYNITSLN